MQRDALMPATLQFPTELRTIIRDLHALGGSISLVGGSEILIDGPPAASACISTLRGHADALEKHFVPGVTDEEATHVRWLLADAGACVVYVTTPDAAQEAVSVICNGQPEVLGVDFETEILPAFKQPVPLKFTNTGRPVTQQPRTSEALDPYRSKVRLVQVWDGGAYCYVFDMRTVAWADLEALFRLPLAIFNATFEVKRLIHEASIEPTVRVYDVMTAHWLSDGVRPSLGEAVRINYNITLPKTLGASDWSADVLSPEQLEYAALDAVLCRLLWVTQQKELFDEFDKQCQELADAVTPAIARMELNGMPVDVAAHRAQIAQWHSDLAEAQAALRTTSPLRDLRRPGDLQRHLEEVLDDDALDAWPRTTGGKLTTRRQQLQLNRGLPGIAALMRVRSLEKLISSFGESLIEEINPVTGRLHGSFLIAGASTGRFSARGPNLQQMPKRTEKGFRRIFAAPPGQLVMALDYSQIELRAVAELISEWFGTDSILRQHFAAGLDAHIATAMSMTGKADPADVTPQERELAKPCNFGLLYRMGNNGFFNYLRACFVPDITYGEACELRARFFVAYPDMARWQDEYARRSREVGYTQTVAGRRWKWVWKAEDPVNVDEDEPFYADRLMGFNGSYAVNHPVQGSCAEVMQVALVRLDKTLRHEPAHLVATVHDEVVMLVPDDADAVGRIGGIAQSEMVAAFVEVFPNAPTIRLVEPKVGLTWGDLQSVELWLTR
jgi:DNA polymerase I-like protein with 3'-5' exonuclease and polymerase domains